MQATLRILFGPAARAMAEADPEKQLGYISAIGTDIPKLPKAAQNQQITANQRSVRGIATMLHLKTRPDRMESVLLSTRLEQNDVEKPWLNEMTSTILHCIRMNAQIRINHAHQINLNWWRWSM
jgi:hypothetical protein